MTRVTLWGGLAICAWAALIPAVAADSQGAPVVTITGQAPQSSLDARVSKLERLMEGQALTGLLTRIQHLQEDVQQLRGDLEVQGNDINGIKQRQRDLYLDIDRRLQQLEAAMAATAAPAGTQPPTTAMQPPGMTPTPAATAPPPAMNPAMSTAATAAPSAATPTVATSTSNPEQEQAAYEKAFNLLKDGHYDDAIAAFRGMLNTYPEGKLADNAQYWIGEANFAVRRFQEAANEFNKVINTYPQSLKVPDAMLKLGFSYYELGDWTKARNSLEQLKTRYPQSTASQLADRRLQKMKAEGH